MNYLNHHHLWIFWHLGRLSSFTKTAEALRISQSAVTAQIKALEDSIGLELVDRSNKRRPTLTSEGRRVFDYASIIFEASGELLHWAKSGETKRVQTLKVGALSGLSRNLQFEFLSPALGQDNIRLEVTTGDQDKLITLLKDHQLDIILSSRNVRPEGRVSFYSHTLTTSPIVFVIMKGLRKKGSHLKQYIQDHGLYIPGQNFEARAELDAYLDELGASRVVGEIDDTALLRIFATRSGSVVALPEMGIQNDIESGDVLVVARKTGIEQKFYAITRDKKIPNKVVESLVKGIRHIKK